MRFHLVVFSLVSMAACFGSTRQIAPPVSVQQETGQPDSEGACFSRCQQGDREACAALTDTLRAVCGEENPAACGRLALLYEQSGRPELARELDEQSCRWGYHASCTRLALQYSTGVGVGIDFEQAAIMVRRACTATDPLGCPSPEIVEEAPDEIRVSWTRGLAVYNRACELGYGDACNALAVMYDLGIGVPRNQYESERFYQRACDTGDDASCELFNFVFGPFHPPRTPVARDTGQYEDLCAAGYAQACFRLGLVYLRGNHESLSLKLAERFLGKACRYGIASACPTAKEVLMRRHGFQTGTGWRVVKIEACDRSQPLCRDHGLAITARTGGTSPIIIAKPEEAEETLYRAALYQHACEAGHDGACFRLGSMFADGAQLPQNRDRAVDYLSQACLRGNNALACTQLQDQLEPRRRPIPSRHDATRIASAQVY